MVVVMVVVVVELMNIKRMLQMKNLAWSLQCCSQKEGKQETDEKEGDLKERNKERRNKRKKKKTERKPDFLSKMSALLYHWGKLAYLHG